MRVGMSFFSSLRLTGLPLSSTIVSNSPQGDAESRRAPCPPAIGADVGGAVAVTLVVLGTAVGVLLCLFLMTTKPAIPSTITTAAAMPIIIPVLLFFGASAPGAIWRSIIVASAFPPLHF